MAKVRSGKYRRGNSLHKNGMFSIDFNGFADYAEKIDLLGGDLKQIFTEALEDAFETVQADTLAAIDDAYLPAEGEYSQGDTADSVIDDKRVHWSGSVGEISLGFDKTKKGAGGWLITGTPRMKPDAKLAAIYDSKGYMKRLSYQIEKVFQAEVKRLMGG